MKLFSALLVLAMFASPAFAQQAKVFWGSDFKLNRSSTDLAVVLADNTGVYLQEGHEVLTSYFLVGETSRQAATLVKLNKSLAEQYRNDFNKELRGKEFYQFFAMQTKLYIFATEYSRRQKTLTLYAAEVDKATGHLAGKWVELENWQKEAQKDNIRYKIATNADSTNLVLVSSIEGTEKNTYRVQEFSESLWAAGAPVDITNEFDPKTFQLEDVLYGSNKKIVLVGRIYEYEQGKRKRDKFLDFVHYNIRIYDGKGRQQNEINTDINAKWLVSTKVIQEQDKDFVIAAFYSNEKKGNDINGMLVQRIDPATGNIVTTSQKEINTSLITTPETDTAASQNNEGGKKEREERERLAKIRDESEGFSRYMQFRNIFYTPDNGLVILAEKYHYYSYTLTDYTPGFSGTAATPSYRTYTVFESGDLMMCKVDAQGDINWLEVLPKLQKETIGGETAPNGAGFGVGTYYFAALNRPFYSGFGALQDNNTINLFFNDHTDNAGVLQLGQKIKQETYFLRSNCFNVVLDVATGKYTRKVLFSNKDVPTAMPRLGTYLGRDMYMVGREDPVFGRTRVAVAKITVGS